MMRSGNVLLADDEKVFACSTADLLRREGYICDVAHDGAAALVQLASKSYDVVIADIKMPGNDDLDLIHSIKNIAPDTHVILVTGFPSRDTAIAAVGLPVIAYMTKPLDFEELLKQVDKTLESSQVRKALENARKRTELWQEGLLALDTSLSNHKSATPVKGFLDLSFSNLAGAIMDLRAGMAMMNGQKAEYQQCHIPNCPKLKELSDAIHEAVSALEKTKGSFKSKELGLLRKKLEDLIQKE